MPVGAGIAAAGVAGAAISGSAAKSAAKTQANAAQQASDQQLKMFDTIRNDLSGYRNFGSSALPGLSKLLGIDTGSTGGGGSYSYNGITVPAGVGTPDWGKYLTDNPDVSSYGATHLQDYGDVNQDGTLDLTDFAQGHYNLFGQKEGRALGTVAAPQVTAPAAGTGTGATPTNAIQAQLESLPGYQFARDQGVASVGRALGSKGLTGAQAKGISRFVTGLADQTYGEQVNRLMNVATMGQNAAAQTGTFGQNAASNSGQALIGGANASAAGTVGAANAAAGGLNSAVNGYLTSRILGGSGGGVASSGLYGAPATTTWSGAGYNPGAWGA